MRKIIFVVCLLATTASAEIFKWVDENGVTHYGSQKPMTTASQKMDIKEKSSHENQSPKAMPLEIEAAAEGVMNGLMKNHGNADRLDCARAASNARSGIDTMLEVGARNFEDGYIAKADFQRQGDQLRKIQSRISSGECSAASGATRDFYLCMSNNNNHVAGCAQEHKYGI